MVADPSTELLFYVINTVVTQKGLSSSNNCMRAVGFVFLQFPENGSQKKRKVKKKTTKKKNNAKKKSKMKTEKKKHKKKTQKKKKNQMGSLLPISHGQGDKKRPNLVVTWFHFLQICVRRIRRQGFNCDCASVG